MNNPEFDEEKENKEPIKEPEKKTTFPIELELVEPFTFGDRVVKSITFKRWPNGESVAHLPIDSTLIKRGHYFPICAYMCEEPIEIFRQMSGIDFMSAIVMVSNFL